MYANKARQETSRMGIASFIGWLFGADAAAPPDAIKLDGTTEATLARFLVDVATGRAGMDYVW